MSGESRNLGNYGTERNLVPTGTTALLAVTIIVVGAFCGLGGYLFATTTLQHLQQQGYSLWGGSSFKSPVFPDLGFVGGSAWLNNQPGQSLSIAFATNPMVRGIVGFVGVAFGGLLALFATRHFRGATRQHPSLLIGLALCLIGAQAAFEPPPDSITINLTSHTLSDGGTIIAVGDVSSFGTYTYNTRNHHGTDLFVQQGGDNTDLATFADASDAQAIQTALQNFVTSNGGQL